MHCPPTGAFRMVKSFDESFFNYIWVNCYIIAIFLQHPINILGIDGTQVMVFYITYF